MLCHLIESIQHIGIMLPLKLFAGPSDNQTNIGTECEAAEESNRHTKYVSLY